MNKENYIKDPIEDLESNCSVITDSREHIELEPLKSVLDKLTNRYTLMSERIKELKIENKKLKDSHYKDIELSAMKAELEKMKDDMWRGFPITKEEK